MTLDLYYHPLASFCQKVLIALYETGTPFTGHVVDLMNPDENARFLDLWPAGKMPVLLDDANGRTVPESTIIIEYLQDRYPAAVPILPRDPDERLEARLWDRFFDLYVQVPMQKFVLDRIRAEGERDPRGVAEAGAGLATAYGMIDRHMAGREWAAGGRFGIADCAAAPALFYANVVAPLPAELTNLGAYFERLVARPSVARTIREAQPWFHMFPYRDDLPARFLGPSRTEAPGA